MHMRGAHKVILAALIMIHDGVLGRIRLHELCDGVRRERLLLRFQIPGDGLDGKVDDGFGEIENLCGPRTS